MSYLINVVTNRYKFFNYRDSWNSQWVETFNYSKALHEDLNIRLYLSGLFYRLKIPTNYFFVKRNQNSLIVVSDLFFFKNFKKGVIRHLFKEHLFLVKRYKYVSRFVYTKLYAPLNSIGGTDRLLFEDEIEYELSTLSKNIKYSTIYIPSSENEESLTGILAQIQPYRLVFILNMSVDNLVIYYLASILRFLHFKYFSANYILSFIPDLCTHTPSVQSCIYNVITNIYHDKDYSCSPFYGDSSGVRSWGVVTHLNKLLSDGTAVPKRKAANIFPSKNILLSIVHWVLKHDYLDTKLCIYFIQSLSKYSLLTQFMNSMFFLKSMDFTNKKLLSASFNSAVFKYLVKSKKGYGSYKKYSLTYPLFITSLILQQYYKRIEKTLSLFTRQPVICNFYSIVKGYKNTIAITNAKIICDYVVYLMEENTSIRFIFKRVKDLHITQYNSKTSVEQLYADSDLEYLQQISLKRYPILSMRIEGSGTTKKGTRKQKLFYGDWAKEIELVNKNPTNSFYADVDYYQSYAVTKSSSFGIKVWVFFKTHLYNKNKTFKSLIIY